MSTPNNFPIDDLNEEDTTCPLCMEEMDIIDKNFVPCPCGYRVSSPLLSHTTSHNTLIYSLLFFLYLLTGLHVVLASY